MIINWLGHSCFRIKGTQSSVITDPYSPALGYTLGKQTADIVTISHQHEGHNFVQGIGGDPKVIKGPGEYEIRGVLIIGVDTFHDTERGAKRGRNNIFHITVDDISVCHLGDLAHTLSTRQVEELGTVDILLLPVGGISTMDAKVAAEVVRQLEPKVVIPMHYKTPALKWELETAERFIKEMGATALVPQPKLTVTRTNMPETTKVVLLEY